MAHRHSKPADPPEAEKAREATGPAVSLTVKEIKTMAGMFAYGVHQIMMTVPRYLAEQCADDCEATSYLDLMGRTIETTTGILRKLPPSPDFFFYLDCAEEALELIAERMKDHAHFHGDNGEVTPAPGNVNFKAGAVQ